MGGKIKGLVRDPDRHGNIRWYFRQAGRPKIRLREKFDTPEFYEELRCAKLGIPYGLNDASATHPQLSRIVEGSFSWLVKEYLHRKVSTQAFATRTKKIAVLNDIARSTVVGDGERELGHYAFDSLKLKHIALIRDEKYDTPEAANHRLKTMSAMFNWAIGAGIAEFNPVDKCERFSSSSGGHHTITPEEIDQYLATHGEGTSARFAMSLFRYTGFRISDVAVLGRQHMYTVKNADGVIEHRIKKIPQKNETGSRVVVDIPVLPPLLSAIEHHKSNNLTFMVKQNGDPFTVKGFGNRMRKWFDEAGLEHCSSHGIRKHEAVTAAENGATSEQLKAIFGWKKSSIADVYTQKADRKRLASSGMIHLIKKK